MSTNHPAHTVDMSAIIKRHPETQTYRVDILIHHNGGAMETHFCQNLAEVCQTVAAFESAHLSRFQNAIDYHRVDWRTMAALNTGAAE